MVPDNCCYPKQVTPEWLTDVLNHAGYESTVSDFSMANIGTGQVGQNVRFELKYSKGEGPSSIVGKFASDDPVSRQTGIAVNDYLKEVLFYQQLQPTLDITTPKIYFSAIDLQQPDKFVLMMEDLHPGVQGDQLGGCTADQADLALTELAGLAGPRWCDERLKKIDWLAPAQIGENNTITLMDMFLPGFIERYQHRLTNEHVELATQLGERFESYRALDADIFTLVHIDYRLDNMMFGGPYPLAVVDWSPSIGSGAADAAYFMGTGMDSDYRRQNEKALIKEYHQRLMAYGIDNFSFNTCWQDYRRNSFGGLVMAIIASMIVGQTERGDEMFMVMAKRSAEMAIDLDALDLLS